MLLQVHLVVLSAYGVYSQNSDYPPDYSGNLCDSCVSFNFIVAGAGSAGSTVALRLSEDPSWNILLLERGTDQFNNDTEIPIHWPFTLKTNLDYDYKSEPDEKMYKGLEGQVCSIPRGKASGGSSTINANIFLRGTQKDFDDWKEMGCDGWDYESIKSYFLKLEDYRSEKFDTAIHHTGGPQTVSPLYSTDPAISIFEQGFSETKLNYISDFNGPLNVGYGYSDSSTRDGRRCSTFKGYISLAKSKPNFFYARDVMVRKVVFDESKKAIGVEVSTPGGKTCVVKALNEVILSLGAIVSPQILMLSGIGPKANLESLGIPVIADLPVGRNYHDHASYPGILMTDRMNRTPDEIKQESAKITTGIQELIDRNLATLGLSKLMAFVNTRFDESLFADLQIIINRVPYQAIAHTPNQRHLLNNLFGISEETASLFTEWNDKTDTILIMLILTDVNSRGYLELRSNRPEDYPKIYPKLLSEKEDIDTLLRGVRYIQQVAKTKALTDAGLALVDIKYKACQGHPKDSDDYWMCAFQQIVTGFFHPVGTVRMGAENDTNAVLNPRLQVKCVKNLRVIDGSAIPKCVSVNPNASIIMLAEKAADIIKKDHGKI